MKVSYCGLFPKQQLIQCLVGILRPDRLNSSGEGSEGAEVPQFIIVPAVEDNIVSPLLEQPRLSYRDRVLSAALLVCVMNDQDFHGRDLPTSVWVLRA